MTNNHREAPKEGNDISAELLKVVIIGAGGIGCYYGARLQSQGHHVSYIARNEHLQALKTSGLTLSHPDFYFKDKVSAYSMAELTANYQPNNFDLYILCVKAMVTPVISNSLKNWLTRYQHNITIISLQNGVDNEPILKKHLPNSTIIGGLAVRIGGHVIAPGVVEAKGVAQLILGKWPHAKNDEQRQLQHWALLFNKANIPTKIVNNIRNELWKKLLINNGVNPLSALTSLDTKTLSNHVDFSEIVYHLMEEVARVAVADYETLTMKDVDEMFELIQTFDAIKTSMLVDFEKEKPLEIEAICGAILSRSDLLKCQVPYTKVISALLMHKITSSKKHHE